MIYAVTHKDDPDGRYVKHIEAPTRGQALVERLQEFSESYPDVRYIDFRAREMPPSCDPYGYVRDYYGVPARIGVRVEMNGKPGVIDWPGESTTAYVYVTFDGAAFGVPCHPTWEMTYLEGVTN